MRAGVTASNPERGCGSSIVLPLHRIVQAMPTTTETTMKTVIITGCASGYGLETARHFQAQGWNVVATAQTTRIFDTNTFDARTPRTELRQHRLRHRHHTSSM